MSAGTVAQLRRAVTDPDVVDRYWSHVKTGRPDECWLWMGAISGKGHGRFQIADQRSIRTDRCDNPPHLRRHRAPLRDLGQEVLPGRGP